MFTSINRLLPYRTSAHCAHFQEEEGVGYDFYKSPFSTIFSFQGGSIDLMQSFWGKENHLTI